ncbi:MAG: ABC transporter substrate-binding protein [Candidatus Latescibacteria bacterium]|nr:ABC transporter substrate-binding protein [Candidatus Latescibacterota bacterium]
MRILSYIIVFYAFVGFLGECSPLGADQAERLLRSMKERDRSIKAIVNSETAGETADEREQLSAIVEAMFDFRRFGKVALGRHWQRRTEAEQAEFADLCRRLIVKNYADPKLYTKSEKIEYVDSEVDSTEGVVRTIVHYKDEQSHIDYKLHPVNEKWLVYDMVIDDLSVARNNRSQFYKEIRKSSYEGLVKKLRDKLNEDAADGKGKE